MKRLQDRGLFWTLENILKWLAPVLNLIDEVVQVFLVNFVLGQVFSQNNVRIWIEKPAFTLCFNYLFVCCFHVLGSENVFCDFTIEFVLSVVNYNHGQNRRNWCKETSKQRNSAYNDSNGIVSDLFNLDDGVRLVKTQPESDIGLINSLGASDGFLKINFDLSKLCHLRFSIS